MPVNPFIEEPSFFDNKIRGMWFTGQGMVFNTHGDLGGLQGVWNAQGQVAGIYDAPIQSVWKSGAFQTGSTQKAIKRLHRDMTLGFHIIETEGSTAEDNESDFRSIFAYEEDQWDDNPEPTVLHIDTDSSGERRLDLLMYDTPTLEPDVDPVEGQYFNLILKVRAGQPDWYEYDPATGFHYKTFFQSGSTAASGYIEVENPTDTEMRQEWMLTRATWTVPDVSWRGARNKRKPGGQFSNRTITLRPITAVQGGVRISLDGSKLHVRDFNNTNAVASILPAGVRFIHKIPPWTPKQLLPISYTGAPAGGARAELIQPRRYTRPWGMSF